MARIQKSKKAGTGGARHSERIARFNAELELILETMDAARQTGALLDLSDAEAARLARLALSRWHYRRRLDHLPFDARVTRLAEYLVDTHAGRRIRPVPEPWADLARRLAERLREFPEP